MINSQMDNPFSVGDLVHIPKGVILYDDNNGRESRTFPMPERAIDKPAVGLIINKPFPEWYRVSIGETEYLIRKEDMTLVSGKVIR